jgi:unsaturated pyranuronate lyase
MTPASPSQLPVSGGAAAGPPDEPFPGVRRTSYQTAEATVASYAFAPGAEFPLHHHREEQITVICDGEVEFLVDGETHRLGAGETFVVAPHVEHGLRAGAAGARFLAVVVPRRERADAYTIT